MTIRPMTAADIPAGMRLRELAGWNQTEQDWQRFLKMAPSGCFVACVDGRVRGTVTTLDFEKRLGWVSMVLVDPEYRRQGMGTRLLEAGLSALENLGVETIKLDATSMGRTVYLQRGFVDEYGIAEDGRVFLMRIEELDLIAQLVQWPEVVGVNPRDIVAAAPSQRLIGHRGRASIARVGGEDDARVGVSRDHSCRVIVRSVVPDDELEVLEGLVQDMFDGLANEPDVVVR